MESTMNNFQLAGFTPDIVHETDNFNTIVLMVAANMGIAVLPSYSFTSNSNLGNVVTIPMDEHSDLFEIVAARHNQNLNPTIDIFLSFL